MEVEREKSPYKLEQETTKVAPPDRKLAVPPRELWWIFDFEKKKKTCPSWKSHCSNLTVVQTPTTPPGHRQPPITMCSIIPAPESEAVDGLMSSCVKHEVINQSYRVTRWTSKRRQSLNMMKERGYSIGHTRTTASYLWETRYSTVLFFHNRGTKGFP